MAAPAQSVELAEKASTLLALPFAAGALTAAAFFLIIPESVLTFKGRSSSESSAFAKFGVSLLSGVFTGALIHWVTDHEHGLGKHLCNGKQVAANTDTADDVEAAKALKGEVEEQKEAGKVKPVAWSIFIGDTLHNFVDGIAVAVAFKSCSAATGWVVLLGTVSHEIPQELADYLVLTLEGGIKPCYALLFNFFSGTAAIFSGLIASSVDFGQETTAGLLGFSGGIYLWISLGELLPKIKATSCKSFLVVVITFLVGATAVGLVLHEHSHCSAGGSHAGHGH